jgi:predicted DsbA family dithiol-disulfide isomerase
LSPELYELLAKDVGLDVARFKHDLATHDDVYASSIKRDQGEGGAISVKGTPTYLVGGWALNTRTLDGVRELIAAHDLATPGAARSDGFKRVRSRTEGAAAGVPAAGR